MPHPKFEIVRRLYRYACGYCGVTETGRFHLAMLRLNRPQLVKYRLGQQLQQMLQEKQRLLELQIAEVQKTIAAQEHYLAALQAQIDRLRSTR